MSALTITDVELEFLHLIEDGKQADFRKPSEEWESPPLVDIKAEIIRNLILGLELPSRSDTSNSHPRRYEIAGTSIRLCGARIIGVLDLSDCSGINGNGCYPLHFENCDFVGENEEFYNNPSQRPLAALNISHSKITRISLKQCKIGFIDIHDTEILGDVDFDYIGPLTANGLCQIDANGARIDGTLTISNAELNLKQAEDPSLTVSRAEYALSMKTIEVTGSIHLEPRFRAEGGVNISNCKIAGDLWANGAHIKASGNSAFLAQSSNIGGVVGFTGYSPRANKNSDNAVDDPAKRFHAEGEVNFLGADVGYLQFSGARIDQKDGEKSNRLIFAQMKVRQNVNLTPWLNNSTHEKEPFEANCVVWFSGTEIFGAIEANKARFNHSNGRSFEGSNLRVHGKVDFTNSIIEGLILDGANIYSLEAHGSKFIAELGFSGDHLNVTKDLSLKNVIGGKISLQAANISGSIDANYADIMQPDGFSADYITLGRNLSLESAKIEKLSLQGAKIPQTLSLKKTNLTNFEAQGIEVGDICWSGDLSRVANLQGAKISGEFILGESKENTLNLQQDVEYAAHLNLDEASIARGLRVWGVKVKPVDRGTLLKEPENWLKTPVIVKKKTLSCYDSSYWYEVVFFQPETEGKNYAIASFLYNTKSDKVFLLDGSRDAITEINDDKNVKLSLDTKEKADDYVKFFSANIWADRGAFGIVENSADVRYFLQTNLIRLGVEEVIFKEKGPPWIADAFVIYGNSLFKASFRISANGDVEMLSDEHIANIADDTIVNYISPLRVVKPTHPSDLFSRPFIIDEILQKEEELIRRFSNKVRLVIETVKLEIESQVKKRTSENEKNFPPPSVKLIGTKIGILDDNDGKNWDRLLKLELEGFEYTRFAKADSSNKPFNKAIKEEKTRIWPATLNFFRKLPSNLSFWEKAPDEMSKWPHRLKWLSQEYEKMPPSYEDFKPQSFEQAAKVFIAQGDDEEGVELLREKLRVERKVRYVARGKWVRSALFWVSDVCLGHAISWERIFITFLVSWLIGWLFIDVVNYGYLRLPPVGAGSIVWTSPTIFQRPVLVLNATPVSTIALPSDIDPALQETTAKEFATTTINGQFAKEMRCGAEIESILYSLDVFIPLIDLGQETKCDISNENTLVLLGWRILKAAYAIWGWIVTSSFIVAISGFLRRKIER